MDSAVDAELAPLSEHDNQTFGETLMNTKIILFFLFVALATTGSTCINDGFQVAVNFPITYCGNINAGSNLAFGGSQSIKISDQIGSAYRDNIKNARYYDVRVRVNGAYTGSVSGSGYINGLKLLDFSGQWADFLTPQSLLGSSTHVTPQAAGSAELLRVLNSLTANPNATITLSASGSVSQAPVPAGLSVCIDIYAQADTEVK